MKNNFAMFVNVNNKWKPVKDDRDLIAWQNKEIERLQNIIDKAKEYAKNSGYNISNGILIDILEGDDINETSCN